MVDWVSAPAERWRDMGQDRFDDMRIVGKAQLIRDRQEQRISLCNCLVLPKLIDKDVRFSSIASTKDGASFFVDETDLILFRASMSEVGAVAIVYQCEDAATDRYSRFARVACLLPCRAEASNLSGLLDV